MRPAERLPVGIGLDVRRSLKQGNNVDIARRETKMRLLVFDETTVDPLKAVYDIDRAQGLAVLQ